MEIQFESEQSLPTRAAPESKSFFIPLIIRAGLARDEQGAVRILLFITLLLIVLAILIWFFAMPSGPSITPADYMKAVSHPQPIQ